MRREKEIRPGTSADPPFTFVDLFAGIGGFHTGLAAIGGTCVLACESDLACADVYEENFGIRPVGDIRVDLADASTVPDHDVLCAGFPCQTFSKAGRQEGLEDQTRGTLFFDIARIVEKKRPRFLILENVRNLAAHDHGRTWLIILGRLHELGYRVSSRPLVFSPHLLPPSKGGAPQFRERVFLLAERSTNSDTEKRVSPWDLDWSFHIPNRPGPGWDPQEWDLKEWLTSHPPDEDVDNYLIREEEERWLLAWGDFACRIETPLPGFPLWEPEFKNRPELDGLPKWKREFHRKNANFYRSYKRTVDDWRRVWDPSNFPISRRKFEWQAQDSPRTQPEDIFELLIHFRPSGIRVKRPTYVPALVAITQTSILGWERRRLTPREASSLQGFPLEFRLHQNPTIAYKQLGNAVNTGVVRYLAEELFRYTGFWGKRSEPEIVTLSAEPPEWATIG